MISVLDLTKSFNGKSLFKSLSFTVSPGEKVAITGVSGQGKTTLLKMLAGISSPDSGTISYNNLQFSWQTAKTIRKSISYLPQGVDLMAANGNELCTLLGADTNRSYPIMEIFHLTKEIIQQPFSELSGGEKQRLLLSIILSFSRPILLLDEPTSALDSKSTVRLMDYLWQKPELTVVSTSHNPKWEERCDKVISL